ncbi:MAG: DotU family type IV/VI secretion system protein [Treponema sp.]|nr:DotU family type IV/VI secretion system protein [Treponema sp.]
MSELEHLCRPVLTGLCNYWQLVNTGIQPERETFQRTIDSLLEKAKTQAARNPDLSREYARIERPLIFFIDYLVKEGNFSFKGEWRDLARRYNELSGDEKFFNLLAAALDDPESGSSITLYYLMLGLGFDGDHRSDYGYIETCMKRCAAKAPDDFNVQAEPLVAVPVKKRPPFKRPRLLPVHIALIASLVFMVLCFGINFSSFMKTTQRYRHVLSTATENAIPKSSGILYETPLEDGGVSPNNGD